MSSSKTVESIANAFTPITAAISKAVSKDECYTFIAGFAVAAAYIAFGRGHYYFLYGFVSAPLWIVILGAIGCWIIATGITYGLACILTLIFSVITRIVPSCRINIEASNIIVYSKLQHYYSITSHFAPPKYDKILMNMHQVTLTSSALVILCPLLFSISTIAMVIALVAALALMTFYSAQFVFSQKYYYDMRSLWADSWEVLSDEAKKGLLEDSMKKMVKPNE